MTEQDEARRMLEAHRRHRGAVVIDDAVSAMLAFAARARADERERCARVAESQCYNPPENSEDERWNEAGDHIADVIRSLPSAPNDDGGERP